MFVCVCGSAGGWLFRLFTGDGGMSLETEGGLEPWVVVDSCRRELVSVFFFFFVVVVMLCIGVPDCAPILLAGLG